MPLSKQQIRDRAANDLGLLQLNQSLAAQHVTRIESGYDEVNDELTAGQLKFWSTSVPDRYVPWLVALVAMNCLNTYAVSPERFQRITLGTNNLTQGMDLAKAKIKEISTRAWVAEDEITDY